MSVSVIGKAGRADTPTDPAPLDMIETFVNFRPKELWPKRAMKFDDASQQTRIMLAALEERGYVQPAPNADDRDALINDAAMSALSQFDETMRALSLQRYREFERELGPVLTRCVVMETVHRFRAAGDLQWPDELSEEADKLTMRLASGYGSWLAKNPSLEDVTKITQVVAQHLAGLGALKSDPVATLALKENPLQSAAGQVAEFAQKFRLEKLLTQRSIVGFRLTAES